MRRFIRGRERDTEVKRPTTEGRRLQIFHSHTAAAVSVSTSTHTVSQYAHTASFTPRLSKHGGICGGISSIFTQTVAVSSEARLVVLIFSLLTGFILIRRLEALIPAAVRHVAPLTAFTAC